jgi:hypothetical protein
VVYRALGWLFLAMAVAVAVRDLLAWWTEGGVHLVSLGELWSRLDVASLGSVRTAVQRHLSPSLWAWIVRPVLAVPALVAFLALGVALLWLGRPRTVAEPRVLTGSRSRPRRRRNRSALS